MNYMSVAFLSMLVHLIKLKIDRKEFLKAVRLPPDTELSGFRSGVRWDVRKTIN